jgi:predicted esterase
MIACTSSQHHSFFLMASVHHGLVRVVSPADKNNGREKSGRVYMFHGWAQNEIVFQKRTLSLTKKLNKAGFECVFLRAPIELPPLDDSFNTGRQTARAWFLYDVKKPCDRSKSQMGQPLSYAGLEQSLELIGREFKEVQTNESITVLGFSQGAVLVHLIAALAASRNTHPEFSRIEKAIIISGFPATPTQFPKEELSNIGMPSLHIFGAKDTSVPPKLSQDLARRFSVSTILQHEKGHVIPQQGDMCAYIIQFLLHS